MSQWFLSYDRCPKHGYEAISLQQKEQGGLRLTSAKCCGAWESLRTWRVSPLDLIVDIARESRSLTQEQWFDLRDRIDSLLPKRDEEFVRAQARREGSGE